MTNLVITTKVRNALKYYGQQIRNENVCINSQTLAEVNKLFHAILVYYVAKQDDASKKTLGVSEFSTDSVTKAQNLLDAYTRNLSIDQLNALRTKFDTEGL